MNTGGIFKSILALVCALCFTSIAQSADGGPLQEQIIESKKQYESYIQQLNDSQIESKPDYQTIFLKRINDVMIADRKNERLKRMYLEQIGKQQMAIEQQLIEEQDINQ